MGPSAARTHTFSILLLLAAAGCSSGGESGPTYARLTFPPRGPSAGRMELAAAYPGLRFSFPIFVTQAPDATDRLFVVEQAGRIFVFADDPQTTQATVFLDIRSRVTASGGEEGLLGLAFDPAYATNGFFYVHYTTAVPHQSVIARYQVTSDPDVADPASEAVVLTVLQPFGNHNAGMLEFGPDGMLYIAFGDGGSGGDPFGHGQDRTTLLGSMLRIDVSQGLPYRIPPDNPFVGAGGGVREEIWAYGLRNPWRFSFDRDTGQLWVGDVGQGMREEVSLLARGDNLGWNVYEGEVPFRNPGNLPPTAFRQPLLAYDREQGAAVIGGYVYRGTRLPELFGSYLYGDYVSGRLWAMTQRDGVLQTNAMLGGLVNVVSFGHKRDGEVLLVSHHGTIYRLERGTSGNAPFPRLLSQTGLFRDLGVLAPAAGVHEYSVQAELWSDGAHKRRFVALTGGVMDFTPEEPFTLPQGAVLVKHFELETRVGDPSSRRRLETRVLVHEQAGWSGYTYRWNPAQDDAELIGARATESIEIEDPSAPGGRRTQLWTYPARTDCTTCHNPAAGTLLGIRTRQLNRPITAGGSTKNQLQHWSDLRLLRGLSDPQQLPAYADPSDQAQPLAARARAYLAVNCALCHAPGAPAPTDLDLRITTAEQDLRAIDVRPSHGDLGLPDAWRIRSGSKEASVLWERMRRLDATRMPPLASHLVHQQAVDLIGAWIDALP